MSIRSKISLLVISFLILFSALFISIIYFTIKDDVHSDIIENFSEQQSAISQSQALIYDRLVESALLIGQNPAFKANVSLDHEASVHQILEEFLDLLKVDLISVTNPEAKVLAAYPQAAELDTPWQRKSVNDALAGEYPELDFVQPNIWLLDDLIYQVVSIPITTNYEIIGSLTLGTIIDNHLTDSLKLSEGVDVHFRFKDKMYASSLKDSATIIEINELVSKNLKIINEGMIEDPSFLINYESIDQDNNLYLISSSSTSSSMKLLNGIIKTLLMISLGGIFILLLSGQIIGKIISAPLGPFISAFKNLQKGDLNVHLKEDTKDEFGQLGIAFNNMVKGLRERVQLKSYVGEHTLQKVSNQQEGARQIIAAVLFSDIRGFTAYANKNEPDTVVQMLNNILGIQADLISKHGGSVDKFIGDEVMALFTGERALENCLNCAVEIQNASKENRETSELGLGIGINYGSMILGDIGSQTRRDYTVIGDVVNVASRLCGKAETGEILILSKHLAENQKRGTAEKEYVLKGINEKQLISIL